MFLKSKFVYVGIRIRDMEESVAFYKKVLGMKVVGEGKVTMTRGKTVTLQDGDGGFLLELNYYPPGSRFATRYVVGEGLDHLAFGVKNLDRTVREAKKTGFPVEQEMRTKESRWLYIKDPNGIWIELFQSS
jgi:lactoylglutathione lyase